MAIVFLSLGGNIGDTRGILVSARRLIGGNIGVIAAESALYTSEPWGFLADQNFLNQVIMVDTELSPADVLDHCMLIEAQLGRRRSGKGYASRPIDIDIIFYDSLIVGLPNLTIPHPLMHVRNFVLRPLCSIAPRFVHPVLGKTMEQLLVESPDRLMCEVAG